MTKTVPSYEIKKGSLLQHVSRTCYRAQPLYFGRDGTNRYDDPNKHYGVLYLGPDFATALMESVFHKHKWTTTKNRPITLTEIEQRLVRLVGVRDQLQLANLTAPNVMAAQFGLNLGQLVSRRYGHTKRVSAAIYAMQTPAGTPLFDGILYPSRNNHPSNSIALFEHAAPKVKVIDDLDLSDHREWPDFVKTFGIGVMDDKS